MSKVCNASREILQTEDSLIWEALLRRLARINTIKDNSWTRAENQQIRNPIVRGDLKLNQVTSPQQPLSPAVCRSSILLANAIPFTLGMSLNRRALLKSKIWTLESLACEILHALFVRSKISTRAARGCRIPWYSKL